MQTFLPWPDFRESARCLDYRRLGKQRVEAFQILRTLTGQSSGWANHPAVKMWKGHTWALRLYGLIVCLEWEARGYNDSLFEKIAQIIPESTEYGLPYWFDDEHFHRSHRANLVRKDPAHYVPLFGNLPPEDYVWPLHEPTAQRTPDECSLLNMMIRDQGQAYVDRWAESLLNQARRFGDL